MSVTRPHFRAHLWRCSLLVCFSLLPSVELLHAELLTDDTRIPETAAIVDFSQFFSSGSIRFDAGDPPLEIDDLDNETVLMRPVSGASAVAIILGEHTVVNPNNDYYLGTNGHWGPDRNGFLGVGGGNGSRAVLRIEFIDGPVSAVGGLFNYSPDPRWLPVTMTALAEDLSIIESHGIDMEAPISTPAEIDAGEFRGIWRARDDIFALEISAPFAVIDDIRFFRAIPEPSTLALVSLAFAFAVVAPARRVLLPKSNSSGGKMAS